MSSVLASVILAVRRRARRRRGAAAGSIALLLFGLVASLLYQFGPLQAVWAIRNLSDPAKLATLGHRGANPRLNKIVYWLDEAEQRGMPGALAIRIAQTLNATPDGQAALVSESLLRNLSIAHALGLLTPENRTRLRNGRAAIVTRGPYSNSAVEIDHIVPISLAPEVGNELANLEMLPQALNRKKSNRVGERQLSHARKLHAAGLLSPESLDRLHRRSP